MAASELISVFKFGNPPRQLRQCVANHNALYELAHNQTEMLTPELLSELLKRNPELLTRFVWEQTELQSETQRQAQAAANKGQFERTCKQLSLQPNTANFNLVAEQVGAFDVWSVRQSMEKGLRLASATAQQLNKWRLDDEYREQERLRNLDQFELLEETTKNLQAAAARRHQEQHIRELQAAEHRDQFRGNHNLPATWKGFPLTAEWLRSPACKSHHLKELYRLFSESVITDLYNGKIQGRN